MVVVVHGPVVLTVLVPGIAGVVVLGVEVGGGGPVVAGAAAAGTGVVLAPERGREITGRHRRAFCNKTKNIHKYIEYSKIFHLFKTYFRVETT
jgi:hypothetical protein